MHKIRALRVTPFRAIEDPKGNFEVRVDVLKTLLRPRTGAKVIQALVTVANDPQASVSIRRYYPVGEMAAEGPVSCHPLRLRSPAIPWLLFLGSIVNVARSLWFDK